MWPAMSHHACWGLTLPNVACNELPCLLRSHAAKCRCHFPELDTWLNLAPIPHRNGVGLGNMASATVVKYLTQCGLNMFFASNFTEVWSEGSNCQQVSIGSDSGACLVVPNRHQAHYLKQCWPRYLLLYGITGPQCFNPLWTALNFKMKLKKKKKFCFPRPVLAFWVLSLPASLCLSVCLSLCINHELVCAITHHPLNLRSPNLYQRCKKLWIPIVLWGDWHWPSRSNPNFIIPGLSPE